MPASVARQKAESRSSGIMDLPVRSRAEAIEKINWYAMRWKIEAFHKILKSGCIARRKRQNCAQLSGSPT
jgi:hypothetical protein